MERYADPVIEVEFLAEAAAAADDRRADIASLSRRSPVCLDEDDRPGPADRGT